MTNLAEFQHILVATDFSPHSEAALTQAIWLARRSAAKVVLLHVLPDLRQTLLAASPNSSLDIFAGKSDDFQNDICRDAITRMQALITEHHAEDLDIRCETLVGDASIAIIHAVQQDHHDLVLVGTRGHSTWEQFFLGSTAKRLIRKCPSPVWAVKAEHTGTPRSVMAATDFSEASTQAALVGLDIARLAGAEFHLFHVIDSKDVPEGLIERLAPGATLREEINANAKTRLEAFVELLDPGAMAVQSHLSWGIPSQEVARMADHLNIDLLVLGTVGRSGIKGVVLGNTAEKVIDTCHCSTLTLKPEGFISPIDPPFWPLHSDSELHTD